MNDTKNPTRDAPPTEAVEEQQVAAPDPFAGPFDDEEDDDDMKVERASHAQETHEHDDVHKAYPDNFEPPELLDAPTPRPGFVQRWISTQVNGVPDVRNMARKANAGWRPRNKDTVEPGTHAPTIKHGQFEDCIGIEGMVLMERPKELHEAYARKNRKKVDDLNRAVDENLLRVHTPGMGLGQPSMTNTSRVTRGQRPDPASD